MDVQADVLLGGLEELGHVLLREPNSFILKPALHTRTPVLRLVEMISDRGRDALLMLSPPCRRRQGQPVASSR